MTRCENERRLFPGCDIIPGSWQISSMEERGQSSQGDLYGLITQFPVITESTTF